MFARQNICQIMACLLSLKNGGNILVKINTFLTSNTISVIELLMELFDDIRIVKPLASPAELPEVWIVGYKFNLTLFEKYKDNLMTYIDEYPVDNEEHYVIKIHETKVRDIKEYLNYIAYRIYILNMIPKMQINLDIFNHPDYQLNNVQQTSYNMLSHQKNLAIKNEQETDLHKINKDIQQLYHDIIIKLTKQDFKYILDETFENWKINMNL